MKYILDVHTRYSNAVRTGVTTNKPINKQGFSVSYYRGMEKKWQKVEKFTYKLTWKGRKKDAAKWEGFSSSYSFASRGKSESGNNFCTMTNRKKMPCTTIIFIRSVLALQQRQRKNLSLWEYMRKTSSFYYFSLFKENCASYTSTLEVKIQNKISN